MDTRQRTVKPDGISFSEARSSDPAGTSQTATETLESAKRFRWKEVRTGDCQMTSIQTAVHTGRVLLVRQPHSFEWQ